MVFEVEAAMATEAGIRGSIDVLGPVEADGRTRSACFGAISLFTAEEDSGVDCFAAYRGEPDPVGYDLVGGFFAFFLLAMRAGWFRRRERRRRRAKEEDRVLSRFVRTGEKSKHRYILLSNVVV